MMRLNIVSMIIDDVGLWYDNDMENLALHWLNVFCAIFDPRDLSCND